MIQCRRATAGLAVLSIGQLAGAMRKQSLEDVSCVGLKNHLSFSTVEMSFGTGPPQTFEVIADTGSDVLIIEDCVCEEGATCQKDGRCFRGYNSETFQVKDPPTAMTITYASGPIKGVMATDEVKLGDTSATMPDSLMLMAENDLDDDMQIQGILGLGPPKPASDSYLDQANVPRFSMCLHEDSATGSLRMGSGVELGKPLKSVGDDHWALNFAGIKVLSGAGQESAVPICGSGAACIAIPDSGTTLIIAPRAHLEALYAEICGVWPACGDAASLLSLGGQEAAEQAVQMKARAFLRLASECDLDSMPSLSFEVVGANNESDSLVLSPEDYMVLTDQALDENEPPLGPRDALCRPAFYPMDFGDDEMESSQLWILGTPFFYLFNVAFNRDSKAVSFNRGGCPACGGASSGSLVAHAAKKRRRSLYSRPRVPYINTSKPL